MESPPVRSPTPTMTYYSTVISRNGNPQRISVTLPYITAIASDPHYAAPPPLPEPEQLCPFDRPPRWSEKFIRRTLGKDRKHTRKLVTGLRYAATVRRIEREGA